MCNIYLYINAMATTLQPIVTDDDVECELIRIANGLWKQLNDDCMIDPVIERVFAPNESRIVKWELIDGRIKLTLHIGTKRVVYAS